MSNDRGTFEPHVACRCVDCADKHGDQADPELHELAILRQKAALTDLRERERNTAQMERDQLRQQLAAVDEALGYRSPSTTRLKAIAELVERADHWHTHVCNPVPW